jgi:hypothetical protein
MVNRQATDRHTIVGIMIFLVTATAGCGSDAPFQVVPVTGQIAYRDGSFVPADQMRVTFFPQEIESRDQGAPRAASAYANVKDGTFSDLTTWKHSDGAIVGRHKVVVQALKLGPSGVGEPTSAVARRYGSAKTTPLEVEVTARGDNHFDLTVEKGSSGKRRTDASD